MEKYQHLNEAEQRELERLSKMTDDASLDRFWELLTKEATGSERITRDKQALRESVKQFHPEWTDDQLDIFVEGRVKPKTENDLEEAQAKIAAKGEVKNLGYSRPSGKGDREALIVSLKRAHPDWTDRQIEIFLNPEGKAMSESERHLIETVGEEREDFIARVATAYRELNPGASEEDAAKWTQDNEKRVQAKSKEEGYGAATVSQLVGAVLQDDRDKAEAQEIPDALAALHPEWPAEKRAAWLKKHETLLLAFKGLHPEWTGTQLVIAVDDEEKGSSPLPWEGK